MKSLNFRLEIDEDGWPPAGAECLHVEPVPQGYQIKNFPIFIKNLAYDDIISVQLDEEGYVSDWRMIEESGHSTIWIMNYQEGDLLDQLEKLGCGHSCVERWKLCAINVPPTVAIADVDAIVEPYVSEGRVSAAYPAFRH
jgi:hypothetical protein